MVALTLILVLAMGGAPADALQSVAPPCVKGRLEKIPPHESKTQLSAWTKESAFPWADREPEIQDPLAPIPSLTLYNHALDKVAAAKQAAEKLNKIATNKKIEDCMKRMETLKKLKARMTKLEAAAARRLKDAQALRMAEIKRKAALPRMLMQSMRDLRVIRCSRLRAEKAAAKAQQAREAADREILKHEQALQSIISTRELHTKLRAMEDERVAKAAKVAAAEIRQEHAAYLKLKAKISAEANGDISRVNQSTYEATKYITNVSTAALDSVNRLAEEAVRKQRQMLRVQVEYGKSAKSFKSSSQSASVAVSRQYLDAAEVEVARLANTQFRAKAANATKQWKKRKFTSAKASEIAARAARADARMERKRTASLVHADAAAHRAVDVLSSAAVDMANLTATMKIGRDLATAQTVPFMEGFKKGIFSMPKQR